MVLTTISMQRPAKIEEVIGVAPGEAIVTRAVSIPGKRRGQIESALPYSLEEHLTEDVDNLHFTLMQWEPGKDAHAAVVSREQLRQWIESFRLVGHRR